MAEIVVREAVGGDDVAAVRLLLEKYGRYLAANPHGASICIDSYAEELASLPGPMLPCCWRWWMGRPQDALL